MGNNQRNRLFLALLVGIICDSGMASFPLGINLRMMSQLQLDSPCIASLVGPPTKSCIQWQPNVDAGTAYDPSRRILFAGAGDAYLHVLDADTGLPLSQVTTKGRVITDPLLSEASSRIFVGTDKGIIHGLDAYSYKSIFSFAADSKIENNLLIVDDSLIFSSAVGTLYNIDANTGALKWKLERPLATARLRLQQNSNIIKFDDVVKGVKESWLVFPHADGYLLIVNANTGAVKKTISFGTARSNGFPDIVAPMVWFKNKLWAASHDLGLLSLDIQGGIFRDLRNLKGIVQLVSDGENIYAATADMLIAINEAGDVLWKNNVGEIKTRLARAGFPFQTFKPEGRSVFYGLPSRLLLSPHHIIMATSAGSLGIFSKVNGQVRKIVAHQVGLGPKINWAGQAQFVVVSKRGLLMKYQITDLGIMIP